jgi:hypothetical protein
MQTAPVHFWDPAAFGNITLRDEVFDLFAKEKLHTQMNADNPNYWKVPPAGSAEAERWNQDLQQAGVTQDEIREFILEYAGDCRPKGDSLVKLGNHASGGRCLVALQASSTKFIALRYLNHGDYLACISGIQSRWAAFEGNVNVDSYAAIFTDASNPAEVDD